MPELDPESINGSPPDLAGVLCERLLVQEFWYDGSQEEEANVIYLLAGGQWLRLYFDWGVVFWREASEQEIQTPPFKDDSGAENTYPIRDLGAELKRDGQRIKGYAMEAIADGACVMIGFEDGLSIVFESVNDSTAIRVEQ